MRAQPIMFRGASYGRAEPHPHNRRQSQGEGTLVLRVADINGFAAVVRNGAALTSGPPPLEPPPPLKPPPPNPMLSSYLKPWKVR